MGGSILEMDRFISIKMEVTESECFTTILDLYYLIAAKFGYICDQIEFVPSRICVTPAVMDRVFEYYSQQGHSKESIGMHWLIYGPKANLTDEGFVVEIQKGFIEDKPS